MSALARVRRRDLWIAAILVVVTGVIVFMQSTFMDARLFAPATVDTWFDADIARVVSNLTDRWSNQNRGTVHPLFSPLLFPPAFMLDRLFGMDSVVAVRTVYAALAGMWFAAFFAFLRLVGLRRSDALLGCLVAATSAASIFWFAVPETHSVGGLSILLALVLVAASRHILVPWLGIVAVSALSLGITVTNWAAGVLATLFARPLRKAILLSALALVVVVGLSIGARRLMPSLGLMFAESASEAGFVFAPEALGPGAVSRSFFLHTMVMPAIDVADRPGAGLWPVMVTQSAAPGSAGWAGRIALGCWIGLLAVGAVMMMRAPAFHRLRWFILLILASQFVLYLAFGAETFLYSPNWLPLLLAIAMASFVTRARRLAMVLAVGLVASGGTNNVMQWHRANELFDDHPQLYHGIHEEQALRPDDPWPRDVDAARILEDGERGLDAAFHLPGGTLNPALDQFSVSFWVLDPDGALLTTSDALASASIRQQPVAPEDSSLSIETTTPFYASRWSIVEPRRARLEIRVPEGPHTVAILFRAVGPRPGPIRSIEWKDNRLLINDRWTATLEPEAVTARLGVEGSADWLEASGWTTADSASVSSPGGWAAARIELAPGRSYTLIIEDTDPDGSIDRHLFWIPADAS